MSTDLRALCAELTDFLAELPFATCEELVVRARAALMADGPAVPKGREPASVASEPSDEELDDCADELLDWNLEGHRAFARAVLARYGHQPAPPAQRHPEPVPVSERLPELRGMFHRILCVARSSGQRPVGNIELADRLIKAVVSWSALPLPAGEVSDDR